MRTGKWRTHKKPKLATLKRKLDILFSLHIRSRDKALPCITCGKKTDLQAGHFRRRELMATRWDERNVNGQCSRCNCWLGGAPYEYGMAIDRKWGAGTAKELFALSQTIKQFTLKELEELLTKYQ